jgi:effector-binding domain-containing protein
MSPSTHEVTEIDAQPRWVAGVTVPVPIGRVAQYFGAALDQVYAAGRAGKIVLDGQNIFIYHPPIDGNLTVDFCVGTGGPFAAIGAVSSLQTPAGRAARTVHVGDYGGIGGANRAILDWCRANGRTIAGPSWEVYGHMGPGPELPRTEIYYLLRD